MKKCRKRKVSNFNFMDRLEVILKETIALREYPKCFIVNSKEKDMAIEISLSEESFDVKARNHRGVNVLKRYLFVFI